MARTAHCDDERLPLRRHAQHIGDAVAHLTGREVGVAADGAHEQPPHRLAGRALGESRVAANREPGTAQPAAGTPKPPLQAQRHRFVADPEGRDADEQDVRLITLQPSIDDGGEHRARPGGALHSLRWRANELGSGAFGHRRAAHLLGDVRQQVVAVREPKDANHGGTMARMGRAGQGREVLSGVSARRQSQQSPHRRLCGARAAWSEGRSAGRRPGPGHPRAPGGRSTARDALRPLSQGRR